MTLSDAPASVADMMNRILLYPIALALSTLFMTGCNHSPRVTRLPDGKHCLLSVPDVGSRFGANGSVKRGSDGEAEPEATVDYGVTWGDKSYVVLCDNIDPDPSKPLATGRGTASGGGAAGEGAGAGAAAKPAALTAPDTATKVIPTVNATTGKLVAELKAAKTPVQKSAAKQLLAESIPLYEAIGRLGDPQPKNTGQISFDQAIKNLRAATAPARVASAGHDRKPTSAGAKPPGAPGHDSLHAPSRLGIMAFDSTPATPKPAPAAPASPEKAKKYPAVKATREAILRKAQQLSNKADRIQALR